MSKIIVNGCKVVGYLHESKIYQSKVLWKVYKSNSELLGVFQTEEAALKFASFQ
jgi:hypothetical protein